MDVINVWQKQQPKIFCKKFVLRNVAKFTGKHLEACNFIKNKTLAQVFYCEFCDISKNTCSYRTPPVAASVHISKSIRENTYIHYTVPEPFFDKVAGLRHRCFPLSFVKFLRTPFFLEHLCWLLLVWPQSLTT